MDIEELGNPNRKTKGPDEDADNGSSRKRRISVTPEDPQKLEEVADNLGLPMSKVYNMGFQALLEKHEFE